MSDWRFIAFDLRTGARLTNLNVQAWRSSDVLNDAGSWSATVELDGRAATTTTSRRTTVADATRKGRSLIVAERDGVPVYAGIVWARRYNAQSRLLDVAGRGLLSYFDRFSQRELLTYTGVEQCTIVSNLIAAVQNRPGCNIGIDVPAVVSGISRDRTYDAFSGKKFGELIRDLVAVQQGPDIDMRVEYDAGAPVRRCRQWWPRRGRDFEQTGLRFRAPGNAVLFEVDDDGSDMAAFIVALGAGDGADMLITTAARNDLIDAGWPVYEDTKAWKDVSVLTTLAGHAQAEVDRRAGVDSETYRLRVDPDFQGQPWGSWDLGDDAMLVVDDDPLYPAGVDGLPGLAALRRVVQHDWTVTGSAEELTVMLDRKVIT